MIQTFRRWARGGRGVESFRRAALGAAAIVTVWLAGCRPQGRPPPPPDAATIRAIWVTRWDYKAADDIAKIMHNCRAAGFNTVLFQVRGNGTVMYPSRLEPWAEELGGRDPGFDPLRVACDEAHRRGLALHAWVNVMPGWRGDKPPTDRRQLYHAHPDWFWHDARGRRQPLGWYNSLNPCYPEVRAYLVAVMEEIVAGYPVDGLHLDYIRFPNEWHKSYGASRRVPDYPRDRKTLALFAEATGRSPDSDPAVWIQWRTDQVTQLVREIRMMLRGVRPQADLSAAVGAVPQEARRTHFQDSLRWIDEGLIDAVYPMNYVDGVDAFAERMRHWLDARRRVAVVTGVMVDNRPADLVLRQLQQSRRITAHFAAFAYNSLFERFNHQGTPVRDANSSGRAALRSRMIPFVRSVAGAGG